MVFIVFQPVSTISTCISICNIKVNFSSFFFYIQPRLLDEYSDPVDLKKQIQEEMLGACAVPVMEDDYSVPYEVKKLFKGMLYCTIQLLQMGATKRFFGQYGGLFVP